VLAWQLSADVLFCPEEDKKEERNCLLPMKRSLTKNERLKKRKEIRALFAKANGVSVAGMKMLFRENGLEQNRILLSPARQFQTAVRRNRIKRQVREIYRLSKEKVVQGFDIAFIVYTGDYSFSDRQAQISMLFMKAKSQIMNR
jgi:ribonuclease P protein component